MPIGEIIVATIPSLLTASGELIRIMWDKLHSPNKSDESENRLTDLEELKNKVKRLEEITNTQNQLNEDFKKILIKIKNQVVALWIVSCTGWLFFILAAIYLLIKYLK